MSALASRLARSNLFIIALFAAVLLVVSGCALAIDNARLTARAVIATRVSVDTLMNRYRDQGIPLAQAAMATAREIDADPQVRYALFDDKGKLLAGAPDLKDQGQAAAAMVKVAPLDFLPPPGRELRTPTSAAPSLGPGGPSRRRVVRDVELRVAGDPPLLMRFVGMPHHTESFTRFPGGYALVVGNAALFSPSIWRYLGFVVLLTVLAMIASLYATRRAADQALSPVYSVTNALQRFTSGDFSRFTPAAAEEKGGGDLFRAYNAAASTASAAVSERQRLEANMRQFVADAGHELRTPLTVIMGYIDVLHRGAIAEQNLARQILETMRSEGEHMRVLIGKLLLLARLESPDSYNEELIDLTALARKVVETEKPLANGSTLTFAGNGACYAMADEDEVREALHNIVDNAIKYAPGATIRTSVEGDGGQAVIRIEDDGPGMSDEDRSHAFERFFRGGARRDVPGSGLGLAIAKRSIERAHGTIALDSRRHKGTTVTMRLPLAAQNPAASQVDANGSLRQ